MSKRAQPEPGAPAKPAVLSRADLTRVGQTLARAEEDAPLSPAARALAAECRALCVAYETLRLAHRDAAELASVRFAVIAIYAKDNDRLVGQNLAMAHALERFAKARAGRAA